MSSVGFDGKDRSEVEDKTRKRFLLGLALFAAYLVYWVIVWRLAPPEIVAQIYFPLASIMGVATSPVTVGLIEAFPLIVTLVTLWILGILQRNVLSWLIWLAGSGLLSYAAFINIEIFGA